jgi:hypothetical protein
MLADVGVWVARGETIPFHRTGSWAERSVWQALAIGSIAEGREVHDTTDVSTVANGRSPSLMPTLTEWMIFYAARG